jgi:hypothetical protein
MIYRHYVRLLLYFAAIVMRLPFISSYDFRITGEGGFFQYITDVEGNQIGARFLNPIFDEKGNRIGTNQGYTYYFPPDTGFTVGAIEETQSAYAAASFPTRTFYFKDGTITFVNEAIVAASGAYEKYYNPGGGTFREIITSNNPYEAKVWLIRPGDATSGTMRRGIDVITIIWATCTVSSMVLLAGF